MSWLFTTDDQSIGASASVLQGIMLNIQGWIEYSRFNEYSRLISLGLTALISLQSKGFSRVYSSITICKHQFFGTQSSLWSNSHRYMTPGKTITLTLWTFVGKVMCLLFNTMSRFVIALLPRSRHLLISWLQSPSEVILEPKELKSATVSTLTQPICHEVMGPDAMMLVFWMLSFKPAFSLSSFTFIKRLFSSSSLSAIRVVLSVYLRLLIFLPAISIPAYDSTSLAFHMRYSADKLNKHTN